MSFGLNNVRAEFMHLMNRVFWSYLISFVIVHIDEILVYSMNKGEHMNHLRVVLQVFKEYQLFAMYSKCEYSLRLVAFFGHIISIEWVEVYPRKT